MLRNGNGMFLSELETRASVDLEEKVQDAIRGFRYCLRELDVHQSLIEDVTSRLLMLLVQEFCAPGILINAALSVEANGHVRKSIAHLN